MYFCKGVKNVNEIKERKEKRILVRVVGFSIVESASRYGDKGTADFLLASESQLSSTLTPLLLL